MPDFDFISSAADLDAVPYIGSRNLAEQTADSNRVYGVMVQSAAIHPTWSVDDIACYLVNDEGIDATVVIAVLRETGYTVATMWQLAKDSADRIFSRPEPATDTPDGPLFEQISEDGYACTACGATDSLDGEDVPSMYAGTESYQKCSRCGSTDADADPFKGTRRVTNARTGATYTYAA